MPSDTPLLTLIHVSDLHIGDKLGGANAGQYDSRVEWYIKHIRILKGLLGHHFVALQDLQNFVRWDLEAKYDALIITGDFTRNGASAQMTFARAFVTGSLPSSHGGVGLLCGPRAWGYLATFGNHDFWSGRNNPWSLSKPRWDEHLTLPHVWTLRLTENCALEFLSIDTDTEIPPWSPDRVLARGKFTKQIDQLEELLNQETDRGRDRIRILVLHHSLIYRCPRHEGILEIDYHCRERLKRFLQERTVSVIVTGHIHEVAVEPLVVGEEGAETSVLEARCGTTTMRDIWPDDWKREMGNEDRASLDRNSLLVHQITDRGGNFFWNSKRYERLKYRNFVETQAYDAQLLRRVAGGVV